MLLADGLKPEEIRRVTNVQSKNTVKAYRREYNQGGIAAIKALNFRQAESSLAPYTSEILSYFETNAPSTIAQICVDIQKITGISLQETAVRTFIKSLGVKRRKTVSIPAGAKPAAQQVYHDTQLQPRLQEAREGKRRVLFVDSAHFVLGAFLSFVWGLTRPFVRTPSGRQRYNVLGALDAITHELITVTNDTYITSTQVCELLNKIHVSSTLPVTLILDNARYQKCKLVAELAEKLNIELLYLPAYSPNLNLIERLWKQTKKTCLNAKYYPDFASFKTAINHFLDHTQTVYKAELDSLLTLKFQLFSEEDIRQAA